MLTKREIIEYYTLVVKMAFYFTCNFITNTKLDLVYNIEVFYKFASLLPWPETMNTLMKLSQARDMFVIDFVASTIQICQNILYLCIMLTPITLSSLICFVPSSVWVMTTMNSCS
jgi:hypothetical protein